MKIAITGEKGLIGSFLKKRLEQEGHKIVLTCDLRDGKNILDLKDMEAHKPIDVLIHLAADCKINKSISNPEKIFDENVKGTFSVMEFCRKNHISKVMYFSSSRVLSPEKNPYTAAKVYGEELCKAYYNAYGIKYIIIRPSTVYAPFWDKTERLMHLFCVNALKGGNLEIYGNPKIKTLDFTYIDDFIKGIMLALGGGWNKEYNLSGGEEFNVYELAKNIIKKTASNSKIIVRDAETAQPQKVCVDVSEIEELGFKPKISLDRGVDKTLKFYKKELLKIEAEKL